MRIRIRFITLMQIRIRILFDADADPASDPTFLPNADPDSDPSFRIRRIRIRNTDIEHTLLSGGEVRGHNRDVQEAAGGDGWPEGPDQVPGGEEHRVHSEEPGSGGRAGQPQQETAAGLVVILWNFTVVFKEQSQIINCFFGVSFF